MSSTRERENVWCSPIELLDRMGVPAVLLGLDGLMLDGNRAAARLYGLERHDLAGGSLACGALAGCSMLGPWIVECVLAQGDWQGRLEVGSDEETFYDVRATAVPDGDGSSGAVVAAFLNAGTAPGRVEADLNGYAAEPGVDSGIPVQARPGESLRATIDSLSANVAVLNEHGEIVAVNKAWREFAQANGAGSDYLGANYLDVCSAAGEERAALAGAQLRELLAGGRDSIELEYPSQTPTEERWFAIRAMPYASQTERWAIVVHLDITERRRVREQAFLQAALLDELDLAVMATDLDHIIISWNAGAERLYGWSAEEAIGRRADERMLATGTSIDPAIGARLAGGHWDGECDSRRKDGSTFPAYFRIRIVRDDDGHDSAVVWVAMNISERRRSEHQLKVAHDYLRAVIESMGQGMYTLDADGRVTYMNQAAQDVLGWPLSELTGRDMHEVVHHRRADGSPLHSAECPILRTRRDGEVVRVDEDLFFRADGSDVPVAYTAAPFASDGGEGCVVVFEDISERQATARQIERDLEKLAAIKRIRHALDQDGFLLYAQPIIELSTGRSVQRELLIRMRNPDGEGILAPASFLPAAEEYGFIADIDRWVIDRSAAIAASGLAVELNISAVSIGDPTLIEHISNAIARTGADPTKIVFEITETTLVSDEEVACGFVTALHELGCRVALDDFGTGYGGFTYLKQLPIDYLKIDIEFVRDLQHSGASRKVVEAIVNLAHGFELRTVAEGVEDQQTLVLLQELGVDYAQGYHLGRPAELQLPDVAGLALPGPAASGRAR